MGRNFFLRNNKAIAKVESDKKRITDELRSLSKNTSIELDEIIEKHFEREMSIAEELVHIGKSSKGWAFIFNHHDWEFFDSKESLVNWIDSGTIIDDYGMIIPKEDFWDIVDRSEDTFENIKIKKNNFGFVFDEGLWFNFSTTFS